MDRLDEMVRLSREVNAAISVHEAKERAWKRRALAWMVVGAALLRVIQFAVSR